MNEQNNQPAKSGFDITSVVAKLIPVLLYIALAFAVVGFLYYFITSSSASSTPQAAPAPSALL